MWRSNKVSVTANKENEPAIGAGTNGAGKTTTFKMLTNELRPTRGDVYLAGHRLSAALAPARRSTGYCPQAGGLTTALSVVEVLEFYAGALLPVSASPPSSEQSRV